MEVPRRAADLMRDLRAVMRTYRFLGSDYNHSNG